MPKTISTIADLVQLCLDGLAADERRLIGICGPPGSGKSTLSETLRTSLETLRPGIAEVVPMDGFHLDNAVLDEIGARDRKGAPHTFDVGGFLALLRRLARNEDAFIVVPTFDRDLDLSRGSARMITRSAQVVIVEGNYLLLDDPRWEPVRSVFWRTCFIDVPRHELERRLLDRWAEQGCDKQRAAHWVATNDMPNVDLVLERSVEAYWRLRQT
ncbi:MAG: nucleoside/nucleotide kinase family protein [Pseudomonadota bacterium]